MVKGDIASLDERETDIINKIKEVESDQKKLRVQENAILKNVKALESARKRFESLDEKQRGIEAAQKELAKREKILDRETKKAIDARRRFEKKATKIANVKALKENLPALEKRYLKLNNMAKAAEARLLGSSADQLSKRERLKDMESQIKGRELMIEKEKKALSEQEEEMMRREAEIKLQESGWKKRETEAYADFLRRNLQEEPIAGVAKAREEKYPQIYQMIGDIRRKIDTRDITGARRAISNLQSACDEMVSLEDKRMINYDISELKTSIKLASLT
jgi:hypothetical protein